MSALPTTHDDLVKLINKQINETAPKLFAELLAAAVVEGKTCSTMAAKIESERIHNRIAAEQATREKAIEAQQPPIPPYVVVTMSRTSTRSRLSTPLIRADGPNGFPIPVAGGFEIAKDGHGSRVEMPRSEYEAMLGADPAFKKLSDDGELVVTPLSEAEARPIEEIARRYRQNAKSAAGLNTQMVGPRGALAFVGHPATPLPGVGGR